MNLALRPVTVEALHRFRQRRSFLLWSRAILCVLALALILVLMIALLDRARFMPEPVRPWLAVLGYAACGWIAWRLALRHLREAKDHAGAARLAETAEPALRERLLAAVELARTDPSKPVGDSAEFRERLQEEVAVEVARLDWRKGLPVGSLKTWTLAVLGGVAAATLLSLIPSLHLPGFMARAALPFANLERPSSVKIHIIEPAPASTLAPFASEVDLVADIEGPLPDKVVLETVEAGSRPRRVELVNTVSSRFEGLVPVGQNDVRYRLLAADSISPWQTLSARPRPRVLSFTKTVIPPEYTGAEATTVTDDHGDIEAIAGSTVTLRMNSNQPVAGAKVILNPGQPSQKDAPASQAASATEVGASIPVEEQYDSWRVSLVSTETGFTNEESSAWRITAIPDLPPTARITEPLDQAELPPDQSIRLAGLAADDIGLASVKLAHSVNGAEWSERDLAGKSGREAAVQHLFPLGPLGVKAGDTLLLKLVAVDVKGQRAESQPLRVIILEQTVDPRQRQWADDQRRFAQQAASLVESARELKKAMELVKKSERTNKRNPAANDPESTLAKARQQLSQVTEQAGDMWRQLKDSARNAPNHLDALEAELLGARLAQLRHESLDEMQKLTDDTVENTDPLRKAASEAASHADLLAAAAGTFAAEDTARVAAQAARQLQRQENLLTENSLQANRDAAQRPKWQEQQRAAIAATNSVQKDINALRELVDGGTAKNLDQINKQVGEAAADLNASLDKPDQTKSPEHLYGAADNLRQRLGRAADTANAALDRQMEEANKMRQRLQQAGNPALAALEDGRNALQEAAAQAQDPKRKSKPTKDGMTAEQRAQKELAASARQFQDQSELREQNPETNDQTALDMNRLSRATDQIAREAREASGKPDTSKLQQSRNEASQLADTARTLQADAAVQGALTALDKASQPPPPGALDDPAQNASQARAAAEQMRDLPNTLRKAKAPNELADAAQRAADSTRGAADQLQAQAREAANRPPANPQTPQPAESPQLADAITKTADVAARLSDEANAARRALAELTPEVSEMMKNMAQDLRGTQQDTQSAAEDAKQNKPVDEVAQKAMELQPEAAEDAKSMESLQAALRQEANQANLAREDQRQMARSADVALEQMRRKSPQIASNLRQAAQSTQSPQQASSLQNAADAQKQAADALEQLAQNFEKMEAGQQLSEQDLAAMQQMEQNLGIEEPLDEAYNRVRELAEMAEDASEDPSRVLQELEKELPRNPAMQKALAEIARETAMQSEQQVNEKAEQPMMLGLAAELAAHDLARVARHQQRLGRQEAAQQVAKASGELQKTAVNAKADPSKATPDQGMQSKTNAAQAAKAAEQTASNAPPALMHDVLQQAQSLMLAQALDQLDQTLHPMQSQNPGQQQQQSQSSQQAAEKSLSDAKQNQQQSMADARNQGQVPGSKQPSQNTAQNNQKSESDNPQDSQEGGNFKTELADGVLAPDAVLVKGDWGHLPSRVAEDLTEATRQEAPPEYRAAIENYYKAIATKSKQ